MQISKEEDRLRPNWQRHRYKLPYCSGAYGIKDEDITIDRMAARGRRGPSDSTVNGHMAYYLSQRSDYRDDFQNVRLLSIDEEQRQQF